MLNVDNGPSEAVGAGGDSPLYTPGVLNPETHGRLVAEIENISRQTHVPKKYIANSLTKWLSPDEVTIVRSMPSWSDTGLRGLVYSGSFSAHDRLLAICGCMIRNFTDARFLTVHQLIDGVKADDHLRNVSVIAVPDLYVSLQNGKSGLSPWQVSDLYDILQTRVSSDLVTLGYIDNMQRLKSDYGEAFAALMSNFRILKMAGA
jgi:hypothetical protein